MLIKNKSGLFQSSLLLQFKEIQHRFSTKKQGDGRREVGKPGIYFPEQIHGNHVSYVQKELITPGVDGLLATSGFIGVRTADCVPLLFYDQSEKIIGAVHAGWKGTIANIAKQTVLAMRSNPKNIMVCIGPHISMCHYNVPQDRAEKFLRIYPNDQRAVSKINGKWYLDIGYVNLIQLLQAGIAIDHIDAPPTCTYCQKDDFFSYRRDSKETFGEMVAVIGLKR